MRQARLAVALAVALPLVACGTELSTPIDADAGTGRLSVVGFNSIYDQASSDEIRYFAVPTEGAFMVTLIRDQRGELLHRQVVNYGGPPRYDLVSNVELPAGSLAVRVEFRVCSGGCARPSDLNTLSDDELPRLHGRSDACEVTVNLESDEDREVVLVKDGELWECEVERPRPGEGPPEWGRLTVIHDTQGRAPQEAATMSVGSRDEEGLAFGGGNALYPGSAFDPEGASRYDLIRDARFPPGRWEFGVHLFICKDCPHPDTFDGPLGLFLLNNRAERRDLCMFTLDFAPGEHHEIVLVNEDDSYLPACPSE